LLWCPFSDSLLLSKPIWTIATFTSKGISPSSATKKTLPPIVARTAVSFPLLPLRNAPRTSARARVLMIVSINKNAWSHKTENHLDATNLQSIACTLKTQMSLIMSISTSTYALRKRRLTSIATNLSNAKVECAQHLSIDLTSATNASVREPITKP